MADKDQKSADQPPTQPEEVKKDVLKQAIAGLGTATGREKARLEGTDDALKGDDAAEDREIAGGDQIVADYSGQRTQKPVGLQAEAATFAPNGTVNPALVPSPTGPVPGAQVGLSGEALQARQESLIQKQKDALEARQRGPEALTDEQIESMSAADLRAVAADRGYSIPSTSGRHATQRAFRTAQREARASRETAAAGEKKDQS